MSGPMFGASSEHFPAGRTCVRCGAPAGFRAAALCDACATALADRAREMERDALERYVKEDDK